MSAAWWCCSDCGLPLCRVGKEFQAKVREHRPACGPTAGGRMVQLDPDQVDRRWGVRIVELGGRPWANQNEWAKVCVDARRDRLFVGNRDEAETEARWRNLRGGERVRYQAMPLLLGR